MTRRNRRRHRIRPRQQRRHFYDHADSAFEDLFDDEDEAVLDGISAGMKSEENE